MVLVGGITVDGEVPPVDDVVVVPVETTGGATGEVGAPKRNGSLIKVRVIQANGLDHFFVAYLPTEGISSKYPTSLR